MYLYLIISVVCALIMGVHSLMMARPLFPHRAFIACSISTCVGKGSGTVHSGNLFSTPTEIVGCSVKFLYVNINEAMHFKGIDSRVLMQLFIGNLMQLVDYISPCQVTYV